MCYSAEASIITFLVGMSFSLLLISSRIARYRLYGIFFAFVSLMQGIEFVLWQHQECDTFHKSFSVLGMILNHLQPVVLGILTACIFRKNVAFIGLILAVYLAVAIPYSLKYLTDENLHCTQPVDGDPHLLWNWNNVDGHELMYIVFIATFMMIAAVGFDSNASAITFIVGTIVTYATSAVLYPRANVGALWCFWVATLPPFMYGISLYQ